MREVTVIPSLDGIEFLSNPHAIARMRLYSVAIGLASYVCMRWVAAGSLDSVNRVMRSEYSVAKKV